MSKLITKNGQVVKALASKFMFLNANVRIPRIEDFSKMLGVGRGTIQEALNFLRSEKAVELDVRGHLGTKLVSVNRKRLWEIAGFASMIGIMPLPYSKRYEGLATALCEAFEHIDIPFGLAYQQGSYSRILGVANGRYDFAVCSLLSAQYAIADDFNLTIAISLGKRSFVGGHALILKNGFGREIKDNMRVAIDRNSIDQRIMTQKITARRNVKIVDCPYNQIVDMMRNDFIDAAVWNSDEFVEKFAGLDCAMVDLSAYDFSESTEAVIVCKEENSLIKNVLHYAIDPIAIQKTQELVMSNQKLPRY